MELIGAALGHDVDDGAGVAAVLGVKLFVMTRNSCVDSGSALSPCRRVLPGTDVSLLSTPSRRKLLLRSRAPFTVMPPNALVCDVPGESRTSSYGLRVIRGRSVMDR